MGLSQFFKMRSSITSQLTVLCCEGFELTLQNTPHKNRDEIWSMLCFYYCGLLRNTEMDYLFFKAFVLQEPLQVLPESNKHYLRAGRVIKIDR